MFSYQFDQTASDQPRTNNVQTTCRGRRTQWARRGSATTEFTQRAPSGSIRTVAAAICARSLLLLLLLHAPLQRRALVCRRFSFDVDFVRVRARSRRRSVATARQPPQLVLLPAQAVACAGLHRASLRVGGGARAP